MSDEATRPRFTPPPTSAIRLIQKAHMDRVRELEKALHDRAEAQQQIEMQRESMEMLADFLSQHDAVPSGVFTVNRYQQEMDEMELAHAVKFANLTAPATILPERAITLTIRHPDVHNSPFNAKFTGLLRDALIEFGDYQLDVEDRMPSNPPPDPRYPFTASNGCVVDVVPHVQLNPPEPERVQLQHATFQSVDFG